MDRHDATDRSNWRESATACRVKSGSRNTLQTLWCTNRFRLI